MAGSNSTLASQGDLRELGGGGRQDTLGFRLVLRVLLRCLPWLRAVRGHLAALLAAYAGTALVLFPIGLLFLDVAWTRILNGEPLTALEARLFSVDPAVGVAVSALSPSLRHTIAIQLVWFGAAMAALVTPLFIGLYYYQVFILQRINQLLRVALFERIHALSLRFHADSRVGDAIYRLYQDSAVVTQLIEVLFLTPLYAGARFSFSLAVVALFDPRLALVLAFTWLPSLWLGQRMSRRMRVRFRRSREASSALTSRIQETIAGMKVIKAYGAEAREQARFERESRGAFAAAYRARSLFAVFNVITFVAIGGTMLMGQGIATLATRAGSPLLGGRLLASLGFAAWNLGLYNVFKERFSDGSGAVRQLFHAWARAQDMAIGLDRVFEILDLEPEVKDARDAIEMPALRSAVSFRKVSFRYEAERNALEEVDLEAPVGTITAIVGPTGSGKSTLMALLLRLFDPDHGRIEVDGVDLRRFRVASLRSRIAIALQENVLFGATVRENIRYAVPDANDAAVQEAARVACADGFIAALPDRFETLLGERGAKLSTGQRQRLSIARAILKDTPILVLDEPTANLDAETELRVLSNLAAWGKGRVIFLITHRLSTIRRADRIVVLEEGRVVEQGTHDALLARGGALQRLVALETQGQA
jgi:ABC-type multidrug transport system fused ATPase/permease subunit